jgi:hypothetical protein
MGSYGNDALTLKKNVLSSRQNKEKTIYKTKNPLQKNGVYRNKNTVEKVGRKIVGINH